MRHVLLAAGVFLVDSCAAQREEHIHVDPVKIEPIYIRSDVNVSVTRPSAQAVPGDESSRQ